MKIVINTCFGGFNLSELAAVRYAEIKGLKLHVISFGPGPIYSWVPESERHNQDNFCSLSHEERQSSNATYNAQTLTPRNIPRDDPSLVQVVEELGPRASGRFATLEVVEIPDGVSWHIEEYDGLEHIAEDARTWRGIASCGTSAWQIGC